MKTSGLMVAIIIIIQNIQLYLLLLFIHYHNYSHVNLWTHYLCQKMCILLTLYCFFSYSFCMKPNRRKKEGGKIVH